MSHPIYYFTDIHGHYLLYDAIINWCLEQDDQSFIIFGGDSCDRGLDGYKIMRELIENPQVGFLKGNHEDLFTKAARALIGYCAQSDELYSKLKSKDVKIAKSLVELCSLPDVVLHCQNGGSSTLTQWIVEGADEDFISIIEDLPLTFSYQNLDFCHAGSKYDIFKRVYEAEYNQALVNQTDAFTLMWDRKDLPLGWETDRICVFGHTPTVSLPTGIYGRDKSLVRAHPCIWQDKMGAKHKRGGWKIDMDTAAVWSDRAFVLDCRTLETIEFYDDKNINGDNIIITRHNKIL